MNTWSIALLIWACAAVLAPAAAEGADAQAAPVEQGDFEFARAPAPTSNCITPAEYEALRATIARAPRVRPEAATGTVLYADPMGGGGTNSLGKTLINYVDHDPSPGLLDYGCSDITYDGHNGHDIEILSFYDMDEGVPILCAAPGVVADAHDGEFDRMSAQDPNALGNYVIVQNDANGSYAYYWHARKNSVAVSVGQPVSTGQVLAMVGSSGFTDRPHIHFETWNGAVVDPSSGGCQPQPSWWATQLPHVRTLGTVLMDYGVTTLSPTWANILEKPPSKTHVTGGKTVRVWVRVRNLKPIDTLTWRWYRNDVLQSTVNMSGQTFPSFWWYALRTITSSTANWGTWRVDLSRDPYLLAQNYFTVDGNANQPATIAPKVFVTDVDVPVSDQFIGADPDGSVFWYRIATAPLHGTLVQSGGRARKFTYTPNAGFIGVDSVGVYTLDDENLTGPTSYYVFSVGGTLDAPVARAGVERLRAPQPNPMTRGGDLSYTLAAPERVRLVMRDVAGREVRVLDEGERAAGEHRVHWDGRGSASGPIPAGVYFATLAGERRVETRRVVLVP